jgi:hypothetical protein
MMNTALPPMNAHQKHCREEMRHYALAWKRNQRIPDSDGEFFGSRALRKALFWRNESRRVS